MKKLSLMVLLLAALPGRGSDLPRNSPESQGVDSAAIAAFVETANKKIDSLHSLMIVRHGQVIAEGWWAPYDAKTPHSLYSLSKSFTSTGVGMAISANRHVGVRAVNCIDTYTARLSREHNDTNVLCLGARVVGRGLAEDILTIWLGTSPEDNERHRRRVRMIEGSV